MVPPTIDPTPHSLIERLQQPDDSRAWAQFVDLYTPLLISWIRKFRVPDADRADVIQDIFLALVRGLPAFCRDPNQRFRGYLFQVAKSKVIDRLRTRWQTHSPEQLPDELAGPTAEIEAFIDADYRNYLVRRAARVMQAEFEPATWQAFWAVVVEDRKPADVAAELGLSIESVYQAKSRLLRRLRRELDGLWD